MEVARQEEVLRLLSNQTARFMCLNDEGASHQPVPEPLLAHADRLIEPPIPLEIFASTSQAETVATFVNCLVHGRSETVAELLAGGHCASAFFDIRGAWGCLVCVMTPSASAAKAPDDQGLNELPVRRSVSTMSMSGHSLWIDDDSGRMMGYTWDEYVGASSSSFVHPDDLERSQISFAELLRRPGGQTRIRLRLRHRDGHWMWTEITRTNNLHLDDPHILNETLDISGEMAVHIELQERTALLAQLTEAMPLGVLHMTSEGTISLQNRRWVEMTGVEPRDDLATLVENTFEEPDAVMAALTRATSHDVDANVPVRFTSPSLGPRNGLLRQQMVRSNGTAETDSPAHRGTLYTLDDITSTIDFQSELERLARTDHLTQSLNRLGVEEQIALLLSQSLNDEAPLFLLYFDLDDFKLINDQFGHNAGDEILVAAAESIRSAVRPHDIVGRLGGDEFVAVMRNISAADAALIARRIQQTLSETVGVSSAVGIAAAEPEDDFDTFVSRADQRMYMNKRANKRETAKTH